MSFFGCKASRRSGSGQSLWFPEAYSSSLPILANCLQAQQDRLCPSLHILSSPIFPANYSASPPPPARHLTLQAFQLSILSPTPFCKVLITA